MQECPRVALANPGKTWGGTSGSAGGILTVIICDSKKSDVTKKASSETPLEELRRECDEANATAFLFEQKNGSWKVVPVEKFGTERYYFDGLVLANLLNRVTHCQSNDEQRAYLKDAGISIDGKPVGN